MPKPKRTKALDPRGGEGAGGGALPGRGRGGPTSTTQPNGQSFLPKGFSITAALEAEVANSPVLQSTAALALSPTGVKTVSRPDVPHTTPGVALATEEQQDAFCVQAVNNDGVKAAARAWGLDEGAIFYWANTHPPFRAKLNVAMASIWEKQGLALTELLAELLGKDPKEMNQCANAYGRVVDYRLRILGCLNRSLYGERQAPQVNIQNNTGIVCDEETRARLIALNQKLLTTRTETKTRQLEE